MVEIGFAMPAGSTLESEMRLEFAEALEELGYESFWYPHIVSRDIDAFDTFNVLAAVAARTKKIKLGTAVVQVPLYHPVDLARRVVTLDHLSHGRFLFGVGIGWIPKEFENCGVPFEERAGRTNEALVILKRLWTEEEVTYKGRYYSLREVVLEPKPVQKPYPKILVGRATPSRARRGAPDTVVPQDWSEGAIRRVAEFGDGWIPDIKEGTEVLAEGMERIRRAAHDMGRKIDDAQFDLTVVSYASINVHSDPNRALDEAQEFYSVRVGKGFHQVQGNPSFEALKATGMLGTAGAVARRIREWLKVKEEVPALKRIVIMFASLRPVEQLRRFHDEVEPLLRRS
jgi:probable F420-dependent oxidoreductase